MIVQGQVVPIDVQPVTRRPGSDEVQADWLPNKPRYHVPGSVWLPNVGYPELSPEMDDYFRANLQRLSGGDLNRGLLIYCIADCWFSWNAVKRAASYGYTKLYWYRDGTDGWREAELPLQLGNPVPLPKDLD